MTRPAMFTALRPAALAIAAEWRIPGMDPDDVRQEALLALWLATAQHDPERGAWPPFARMAVKAQMVTLLEAATRQKRKADVRELDPERDADPVQLSLLVEHRETLRDAMAQGEAIVRQRARWRENKRRQRAAA